jgi:hypothetical protein
MCGCTALSLQAQRELQRQRQRGELEGCEAEGAFSAAVVKRAAELYAEVSAVSVG